MLTQLSGNKGLLWSRVSEKSDVFVIMKSPTDAGHVTGAHTGHVILAGGSEAAKTGRNWTFSRGARNASYASMQKRWRRVRCAR